MEGDAENAREQMSIEGYWTCRRLALYVCMIPVGLVCVMVCTMVNVILLVSIYLILTGSLVALSLVQFGNTTQLKSIIRFWIWFVVSAFLFMVLLMYPVFKFVLLKHVVIMGLTIANWLTIFATFASLYLLDFFMKALLHFMQQSYTLKHDESSLKVRECCIVVTDCLLFVMAESIASNRIPWFREQKIVGLYVWELIEMTIFTTIGYNAIIMFTHQSVGFTQTHVDIILNHAKLMEPQHKLVLTQLFPMQYLVYYTNGLKSSITFCLSLVLIRLTWILYLKSFVSRTPFAEAIVQLSTPTWFSILICSVLWFLKTCLVLSWADTAIYTRFKSDILKSGTHLYFLGILGRHSHDIFKLNYLGSANAPTSTSSTSYIPLSGQPNNSAGNEVEGSGYWFEVRALHRCRMDERVHLNIQGDTPYRTFLAYINCLIDLTDTDFPNRSIWDKQDDDDMEESSSNIQVRVKKMSAKKRKITKDDLLMHHKTPTMHDVKQVSQYLISAKKDLSDQKFISSILNRLNARPGSDFSEKVRQLIMVEKTNKVTGEIDESKDVQVDDWEYFQQVLLKSKPCSELSIRNWLENGVDSCLFIGDALSSANEVVECLDKIVSCCLVAATFILWLLLTGLASTAVLVAVASPLLAATFIFGETCKTLFQGIIFVYVIQPIHVGDLCSIGVHKMVVKSIGVWRSTFCKIEKLGTREEISYPNSQLSNSVVISHLTEFDWEDVLEFDLGALQIYDVQKLKPQIELNGSYRSFFKKKKRVGLYSIHRYVN